MFCHVAPDQVLGVHDCKSVYHVPFLLSEQGMVTALEKKLKLTKPPLSPWGSSFYGKWQQLADRYSRLHDEVKIVLVGKYTNLQDSYISVVKSLQHASLSVNRKLMLEWVEASDLEPAAKKESPLKYHNAWKVLCSANGILVPGGFGERGTEGKIIAAQWARENKIPYLGICLGLQVAVIEFARNVCGLKDAHSEEFFPNIEHKVVVFMPEISKTHMGGTMRLGSRATVFKKHSEKSVLKKLYGNNEKIWERHRHRYEVNIKYRPQMEEKGLLFVGEDEQGERMEILELQGHPYYVATQYHPEYKSRPLTPSPPFLGLILAASNQLDVYFKQQEACATASQRDPAVPKELLGRYEDGETVLPTTNHGIRL